MTKITSNFNNGAGGWSVVGDESEFNWESTGGNPGGYIAWTDAAAGDNTYWQAPAKFLGDLSAFFGGKLSFDWFESGNDYDFGDVFIGGSNGVTLVADTADPLTDWSHISLSLSTKTQWYINHVGGDIATKQDIKAVLADVYYVQVLAEHVTGEENGGLDNFVLATKHIPPPAVDPAAFGADQHHMAAQFATMHQAPDAGHVVLA